MPQSLNYNEAFRFAEYCYAAEEFLQEYGSAIRWRDCMIDAGELLTFVENVVCKSL